MSSDQENPSGNEESETIEVDGSSISDFLKKSDILAALQQETLANLPAPVKKRINALKNLQLEVTNLEAKFYEEVHLLECKYHKLYQPIHEKRYKIVTGNYEPTEEEGEWKLENELADELSKELKDKANVEDESEKKNEKDASNPDSTTVVGIPAFWLTAFKNVQMISEMIQPCDEPILQHLIDVRTVLLEKEPMGFVLEFHFSPNEHFTNSVLTKEYEMKCCPDPCDPFCFEGPEIVKCKGCKIEWKKGKNVTVKQVKKKQKHKNRSSVTRTVTKQVPNESFFNFFNPPEVPEDSESESYDETQALLTSDFEIGHYIRERVVPNAVLYFTGEAMEDYDDDEEEEEEEEEDESEEEDSEEETADRSATENIKKKGGRHSTRNTGRGGGGENILAKSGADPAECKQQ
ncbi:nucleosome assembly protein 1-like 1 [Planococcus citri]|uniref:nucleosome assembly protein 1-like 1 n=1 Tax=Planococcus citri TaxID=170843 RepID=UPI0031F9CEAB